MTTVRINYGPKLIAHLIQEGRLNEDFFLVDVGASCGLDTLWKVFGDHFRAIGFDPIVHEIDRLKAAETNPKIHYECAFVGRKEAERDRPTSTLETPWFPRTTAALYQEISKKDYAQEVFNQGQEIVHSDKSIDLDSFIKPDEYQAVDFLKIDTDGHDFAVLQGAENLLKEGGVLGLSVETNLQGYYDDQANTFSNVDQFLRQLGFTLFDLDIWRYSRSALPRTFYYDIPAQTQGGQAMWAEAVYFRDLSCPSYSDEWGFDASEQKILKLASLFELYGMPDCAVELLIAGSGQYPALSDPKFLDMLTPTLHGENYSYQQYVQIFRQQPEVFFPGYEKTCSEKRIA